MGFWDIAAGVGQGVPGAIQSVGTLASIANQREQLDLAKTTAANTQAHQDKQLGIAQQGVDIQAKSAETQAKAIEDTRLHQVAQEDLARKTFGLAQAEEGRKAAIFPIEQAQRERANLESVKLNTRNIPVASLTQSIPAADGENVAGWVAKQAEVYFPEAVRSGKFTPKEAAEFKKLLQENEREHATLALKDFEFKTGDLRKTMLDLVDPRNKEKQISREVASLQKKYTMASPEVLRNMATQQVEANIMEEVGKHKGEFAKISEAKKNLMLRFKSIQDQEIAIRKSYANMQELAVGAAGGDPNALEAMRMLTTNAERLEGIKASGRAIPGQVEMAKLKIADLDRKVATFALPAINAKINQLDTLKDTMNEKKFKAYLLEHPNEAEIYKLKNMDVTNPEVFKDRIKNPAVLSQVLTPDQFKAYNSEAAQILTLTRGGGTAIPPSTMAQEAPTVTAQAGFDISSVSTPEDIKKFVYGLKGTDQEKAAIVSQAASVLNPTGKKALVDAITQYNKEEEAAKVKKDSNAKPTNIQPATKTSNLQGPKSIDDRINELRNKKNIWTGAIEPAISGTVKAFKNLREYGKRDLMETRMNQRLEQLVKMKNPQGKPYTNEQIRLTLKNEFPDLF